MTKVILDEEAEQSSTIIILSPILFYSILLLAVIGFLSIFGMCLELIVRLG